MQRTVSATAVIGCFSILLISTLAVAQQKPQGPASAGTTHPLPAQKYDKHFWKVKEHVHAAHVPRLYANEPEFAILRLSSKQFEEFQKDPKLFLNQHHVFAKQVKKASRFSAEKPEFDPADEVWYVTLMHYPGSPVVGKAYPASGPPAEGK